MGQVRLDFSSKNIDPKDHLLSVYIEADSFVYGVFDSSYKQLVHKKHNIQWQSEDPFSAMRSDQVLNLDYSKKSVVIHTQQFAHLSSIDYDPNALEQYFEIKLPKVAYKSDRLTGQDIYVVYPVRKPLLKYIKDEIHPNEFAHASTAMANYVYPSTSDTYIANFGHQSIQFIAVKNGLLHMYNSYHIKSREDALYFAQLASQSAQMSAENDTLHLTGLIDKGSDLYEMLRPYYRYLTLIKPDMHSIATNDLEHKKHHYFMEYIGALCV